jgi:hypothetical protein
VVAAAVALGVTAAAVVGYFLLGGKKPPPPPEAGAAAGPKKLVVTKAAGENTFPTLAKALAKAGPGDTIAIREDRLFEPMLKFDSRTKDLTIESDLPGGKAAVIEYTSSATSVPGAVHFDSVQNVRLRNVEIDGRATAEVGVQVTGFCPGLALEGVTVRAVRAAGVRLTNASGDAAQPVLLDRVRVVQPPGTDGVHAVATGSLETKRVAVRNCRFEGIDRGRAGVRLDGPAGDLEVSGCRLYWLEHGVVFGKLPDARATRPQVVGNTFFEVTVGLLFETPPGQPHGRFAVTASRNYFAQTKYIASRTWGGGPMPDLTAADNAFDGHSGLGSVSVPATRVAAPELPPPNPDNDATFLRFPDGGPEVGPNKVRAGAN